MQVKVGNKEWKLAQKSLRSKIVILVPVLVLFVIGGSFYIRSTTSAPASSEQQNTLAGVGDAFCKQRLLKLEEQFNHRRQVRIDAMFQRNTTKRTERFDVFEPEANCIAEERFGSDTRYLAIGDGPKFVCGVDLIGNKNAKNPKDECLVYSIGSDNDIEFEKAVHDFLGCETHTFDPTLKTAFKGDAYSTFHPWGIGVDGETVRAVYNKRKTNFVTKSLGAIVAELGHNDRTIDIFKIDCERCEYEAMPAFFDLIAAKKIRVNQIQIELHLQSYDAVAKLFMAADRAGMRIFHKERNGWGCGGFRCIEYALVSEEYLRQVNGAVLCGESSKA
ncbi:unnamed protein product [Cylindrotheca closterium]|uniref:Methyltransferase domain-containing protein n=1 Tax=Cylindrotheca closterium TaxID=2856 RepID=A0AAD2FUS5_9STRA|nr:unnamed protein product [Cylindrotheca closterium]